MLNKLIGIICITVYIGLIVCALYALVDTIGNFGWIIVMPEIF